MAELVRVLNNVSVAEAQDVVDKLVDSTRAVYKAVCAFSEGEATCMAGLGTANETLPAPPTAEGK